jgi:hypothetical protein
MALAPSQWAQTEDVCCEYSKPRPVEPKRGDEWFELDEDPVYRHWENEPVAATEPVVSRSLDGLSRLLELSYGYRPPQHYKQRYTRRAPSAGAMFPCELLVLPPPQHGLPCLIYSCENQLFFPIAGSDAAAARDELRARPDSWVVVIVGLFWRSVRRYGMRGYRYVLLDAAALSASLLRNAARAGTDLGLTDVSPSPRLGSMLALRSDEAPLITLELTDLSACAQLPRPNVPANLPHSVAPRVTPHPELGRMVRDVTNYHRAGLRTRGWKLAADPVQIRASLSDPDLRYSASAFSGTWLSRAQLDQVVRHAANTRGLTAAMPGHLCEVFVVVLRVQGVPCGVYRLSRTHAQLRPQRVVDGPARLEREWRIACQNQAILEGSAFATVICQRESNLLAGAEYCEAVLNAGFVDAECQFLATFAAIANTCIGGFDDAQVARLLAAPSLRPLVIHLYGEATVATKVDASGVEMRPDRSW